MNRTNFLKLIMMSFIVSATAIACKKTPHQVTPLPGTTRRPPTDGQMTPPIGGRDIVPPGPNDSNISRSPTDPGTGGFQQGPRINRGDYDGDRETFKERTVYFAFDSAAVKPEDKPKIDAVADYLKTNPTFKVEIEGHCDERGTEGYNLALGERRALSVREYLISIGLGGERINTITYGESQPAIQAHDETAYAKNRRGEFLLLRPKTQ